MQLLQYNKITMQHNTKISADILSYKALSGLTWNYIQPVH